MAWDRGHQQIAGMFQRPSHEKSRRRSQSGVRPRVKSSSAAAPSQIVTRRCLSTISACKIHITCVNRIFCYFQVVGAVLRGGIRVGHRPFVIVIAGPDRVLRDSLACNLAAADFRTVGSAASVDELDWRFLAADRRPAVLILDAGEDPEAAIRQIKRFKEQQPRGRVVVMADRYRPNDLASMYRGGANAILAKSVAQEVFLKCLELVVLEEPFLVSVLHHQARAGPRLTGPERRILQHLGNAGPRLTGPERRILQHLSNGDSNKAIARKTEIPELTVRAHIRTILRKLGVRNRTQAAAWAIRNGLHMRESDGSL
jgi:two-component system nitrate/nitrite response regulator NarL